jgi:ribosomal protein S18 acetylase RimI-like enzyme
MSPDFVWRAMRRADLAEVERIGNAIHIDHPEDEAVFAERLRLCPEGCHVLEGPTAPAGYIISHPWHADRPPPLNSLLGALPAEPGIWYIHDLALCPDARGTGAAGAIVAAIAERARARGLTRMDLIAVGASPPFWTRQGFRHMPLAPAKLASYGDGAGFMVRDLT